VGGTDPRADRQTVDRSVDAGVYSEALEQQLALVRQLMSPIGPSLLQDPAGELLTRRGLGQDTRWRADVLAGEVSYGHPFFWTAPIAQAIQAASRTMPAYTFTEESFPCPLGFVWFEEPLALADRAAAPQLLRAVSWRVGTSPERPAGSGKSALLNGWFVGPRERGPVLRVRESINLGWTLDRAQEAGQESLAVVHREGSPPAESTNLLGAFLGFVAGCLSFLEQRIVSAERRPASRPTRRRLERERYRGETTIGVVELRRREYERAAADASDAAGRDTR
jgi:hypothetical protein